MLLGGSCHLFGDSFQIFLSLRCQFAAPIMVLFHCFQPINLGRTCGPRSWSLCLSGWAWPHFSDVPYRSWLWSRPQRHPGGSGAVPCKQPVCRTNSHHREQGSSLCYSVHPFRDFELPRLFQEDCQTSDELVLVHVFYNNSSHNVASTLPARRKGARHVSQASCLHSWRCFLWV